MVTFWLMKLLVSGSNPLQKRRNVIEKISQNGQI